MSSFFHFRFHFISFPDYFWHAITTMTSYFRTYLCRSTHHDSPSFPLVAPDCRATENHRLVIEESGYRKQYRSIMTKQRKTEKHTFKKNCKHMVHGFMYADIEKHFEHIVIATKPVRLEVDLRDRHGNSTGEKSQVDISDTPLLGVSKRFSQGFGKVLRNHSEKMERTANDIRPGKNEGKMFVMGKRSYDGKFIEYASTDDDLYTKLEKSSETYFKKQGFEGRVVALRGTILEGGKKAGAGACAHSQRPPLPGGSATPYTTMIVTTVNYGNEDHVDGNDGAQGITIWHESKPPSKTQDPYKNCKNWYFLFPNLEVRIDGKWKKGVAVKLRHGTAISWDARVVRHCTAVPQDMLEPPPDGPVSIPSGTYFGVCQKVVNLLEKKALPDGRTLKGKAARKLGVTKRPVAKPAVIKKKRRGRNYTPAASKMKKKRVPLVLDSDTDSTPCSSGHSSTETN